MENLSLSTFIQVGGVLALLGGYGFLIKRNASDIQEIWKVMTEIRNWISSHEKDSNDKRSEYDRGLAVVSKDLGIHRAQTEAQNRYMTERLDSIDKKLDRLIDWKKGD